MKKILSLILGASFLLTSCGGGDSDTTADKKVADEANETVYETAGFSIQIPKDWETIEKNNFTSNVPEQTVVGFRNNIKSDIFTANLNIAQKSVEETLAVKDLAKSSLAIIKTSLIGFEQINENEDKMDYGEDGLVTYSLEFEGKKSASEPIIHFKQLYVVNGGVGYTITAARQQNEDEPVVNALDEMLNSFLLK